MQRVPNMHANRLQLGFLLSSRTAQGQLTVSILCSLRVEIVLIARLQRISFWLITSGLPASSVPPLAPFQGCPWAWTASGLPRPACSVILHCLWREVPTAQKTSRASTNAKLILIHRRRVGPLQLRGPQSTPRESPLCNCINGDKKAEAVQQVPLRIGPGRHAHGSRRNGGLCRRHCLLSASSQKRFR